MSESASEQTELRNMVAAMDAILRLEASLYMHMAEASLDHFAKLGEKSVRGALRAFGKRRGLEMRQAHMAMGWPVNMETLMRHWDAASTYIEQDTMDQGFYSPRLVTHEVAFCPASEVWKAAKFDRWGHVFCDEFHQACVSAYHPHGHVVIPENMMKCGDPVCRFRWVMPPSDGEIDLGERTELGERLAGDYSADTPIATCRQVVKRTLRIIGILYEAFLIRLRQDWGEEGELAFVDGLRRWGAERGRLLSRAHQDLGIIREPANVIRMSDLGYQYVCEVDELEADTRTYRFQIVYSPFVEALSDTGHIEEAHLYFENVFDALVSTYLSSNSSAAFEGMSERGPVISIAL